LSYTSLIWQESVFSSQIPHPGQFLFQIIGFVLTFLNICQESKDILVSELFADLTIQPWTFCVTPKEDSHMPVHH
jgi:hypothetical protein